MSPENEREDLSAGDVESPDKKFIAWTLEDRIERRKYRESFSAVGYVIGLLFYISLLAFVFACAGIAKPEIYIPTLFILAAVPTVVLFRVFEFAREPEVKAAEKTPIGDASPVLKMAQELLKVSSEAISNLASALGKKP